MTILDIIIFAHHEITLGNIGKYFDNVNLNVLWLLFYLLSFRSEKKRYSGLTFFFWFKIAWFVLLLCIFVLYTFKVLHLTVEFNKD